jgi:Tol biopolymer transport system component
VAFQSEASNLVAGDTNAASDIFVRDTQTNTTTRVSVASDGTQTNAGSVTDRPSISADGRYVAFHSTATNLVASEVNGATDVFVKDTQTGTTTRVSVIPASTTGGNNSSTNANLSADGRYVVFQSVATNLVAGDTNGVQDVFRRDTQTGTTIRVSVQGVSGAQANGASGVLNRSISADGRYVASSRRRRTCCRSARLARSTSTA